MITVVFPTGVRVTYEDANFVKYDEVAHRMGIYVRQPSGSMNWCAWAPDNALVTAGNEGILTLPPYGK